MRPRHPAALVCRGTRSSAIMSVALGGGRHAFNFLVHLRSNLVHAYGVR
jgi:hypothetical protein